jgi:hypothetical protein
MRKDTLFTVVVVALGWGVAVAEKTDALITAVLRRLH